VAGDRFLLTGAISASISLAQMERAHEGWLPGYMAGPARAAAEQEMP
jgi:hypothetical protein